MSADARMWHDPATGTWLGNTDLCSTNHPDVEGHASPFITELCEELEACVGVGGLPFWEPSYADDGVGVVLRGYQAR